MVIVDVIRRFTKTLDSISDQQQTLASNNNHNTSVHDNGKYSLTLTHTSSTPPHSRPPPPPPPYTNNDDSKPPYPETDEQNDIIQPPKMTSSSGGFPPPLLKKRKRYRKEYPGESKVITKEMRFVAMKLRNHGVRRLKADSEPLDDENEVEIDGADVATWVPTLDWFLKYLVDSKLVFDTIERVVEDSNDVSWKSIVILFDGIEFCCVDPEMGRTSSYGINTQSFRRTGLERSESLARDLEWFGEQNMLIPDPSSPGVSYAAYLKDLYEKSAPFGQVIAKQVVEKLLVEREFNFYKWDKDAEELLKDVREKLNRLSEHWSRDDKNKCLKEATKSFRHMGQIVRLIIL
ncbi:hypothetical protein RND81_14G146700 [Saponaria officinalis]|uniref:Uncharacterized protein n=1 Tax=Saponaria officinalis TaxID=3572 RepID=A0AAW1GN83_SAPOF